ncbi:MAG: hypothetical protein CME63_02085 [Halobacteriovoraceae bacterium]|nr:hypothetical protein [Halobacteriovoraceae bacterium]|tara:strand:+ start:9562 stop:10671 length:1110 start_codon:yes stop_codon:yes gene_type:complete
MKLKIMIIWMCSAHIAWGFVPSVETSVRPRPRPDHLNTARTVKDGEFYEGKLRLSINLYDALFYQRGEREYILPIMEYLKNEYPKIDFSKIKLNSLNINAKTLSDYSYTRFYDEEGLLLKEVFVPQVENPNVVFGDYINATLNEYEVQNVLYVGVSGVLNINNITAEFQVGRPNFSTNSMRLPLQGAYVGSTEGYQNGDFNEELFREIMNEVYKMTEVQYPEPEPTNQWDNNSWNNNWDDNYNDWNDDDWFQPTQPEYREPTPEVVPYRPSYGTPIYYNRRMTVALGSIGLFGKKITLQMLAGTADLVGYEVIKENGKRKYRELGKRLDSIYSNQVDITLSTFDSNGTVTFIFSNASKDATAYVLGGFN